MDSRRVFRPTLSATAALVLLCALFISLGRWQWQRGNLRALERQQFSQGTERSIELGAGSLSDVPRFQHVRLTGRYDGAHQFLLDNRVFRGRAGFEVLTPLLRDGGRTVLVDRGWVPLLGMRTQLPDIALPSGTAAPRSVSGRVAELPSPGLARGRAPPPAGPTWPKLTSFPDMSELSAAFGATLERRILLLDTQEPDGYARDWQAPGLPAERNWSYAVQWWGFAALAVTLWVVIGLRRGRAAA